MSLPRAAALVMALLCGLPAGASVGVASAQEQADDRPRVDVWLLGNARNRMLEQSLRGAVAPLDVAFRARRAVRLSAVAPPGDRIALALVIEERELVLYQLPEDGEPTELRRIPLRRGLDATARAAAGHVVRTAVESLLPR